MYKEGDMVMKVIVKIILLSCVVYSLDARRWRREGDATQNNVVTTYVRDAVESTYAPAQINNNTSFIFNDWKNLLLPVFETYANSGLTSWFYEGYETLPDFALPLLSQWVTEQVVTKSGMTSSDILPLGQSAGSLTQGCMYVPSSSPSSLGQVITASLNQTTNQYPSFTPQAFLQNQETGSAAQGTASDWASTLNTTVIQNFIQSGFGNTVPQYASAFIEHFSARLALAASAFTSQSTETGLLQYVNQPMGPYGTYNAKGAGTLNSVSIQGSDEPQILQDFISQAQTLFQKARYSRLMYSFPIMQQQINLKGTNSTNNFTLINNQIDLYTVQQNSALTGPYGNAQLFTSPLDAMYSFCGVILIYDSYSGNQIVQTEAQGGTQGWLALARQTGSPYAPVYFLPVTTATPNPAQLAPYNSYDAVDESASVSTSSSVMARQVNFTWQTLNVLGAAESSTSLGIAVSSTPANPDDPIGIYLVDNAGAQLGIDFNTYDLKNFFAYPSQWAVVLKVYSTGPKVLGLVKLNPYDFPLNFTTDQMNSVLGLGAGQNGGGAAVNATGIESQGSSVQAKFSQKDVWDGIGSLYKSVFPQGIFEQETSTGAQTVMANLQQGLLQYSFANLFLQGLFNGYFMSNTYSPIFGSGGVNSYQPIYQNYFAPSATDILFDQVFPTPLVSDWLGENSSLDYFYLRIMLATRLILQNIYCPYDALVMPVSTILNEAQSGFITPPSNMQCVLEYMFENPTATTSIAWPSSSTPPVPTGTIRTIYGQSYTSGSSMASSSYQWILPVE